MAAAAVVEHGGSSECVKKRPAWEAVNLRKDAGVGNSVHYDDCHGHFFRGKSLSLSRLPSPVE